MTDEKAPGPAPANTGGPPPASAPTSADGITAGFVAALVLLLVVLGLGGYWYVKRRAPVPAIVPGSLCDLGPDAVSTPSGLRWKDFQVGTGPSPSKGQTVIVHYHGRLADGSVFDSSRQRGEVFKFTLGMGQVIKGWDEGVASMKVGGVRRLVVPPDLGYGAQGSPPKIPAEATLVFDIELKGIE